MKAIHKFGPNVVRFQMAMGKRRWYIIGFYLTPDASLMIESIVAALREHPQVSGLLVAVYFKVDLSQTEGARREEDIAAFLMTAVL